MKTTHTAADVSRALACIEAICRPTERELAEARLRKAKAMMSEAAAAVLANDPDAADLGDRALMELIAAQANIARIDAALASS